MSWRERLGARAWLGAGAIFTVAVVMAWLGTARAMAFGGEFADPSPNALAAASAYNTAALSICPVTQSTPYCELDAPNSALPPADPNNPESYLNSAYWPAEERPDIEVNAIQQYGYNYQNCSAPATWNHYCFLVDAEAVGYPVSHTPQVGDLFLARCDDFISASGATATNCPLGNIYYVGYVDEISSDGSFIVTEGGTGSGDSGLAFESLSGAMDPNSDFIGFFPPGQSPHLPPVNVAIEINGGTYTGAGTVSDPSGQTCTTTGSPTECIFSEPQAVPITFTATPQAGSTIDEWTTACAGVVGVAKGKTCTITFNSMGGLGINGSLFAVNVAFKAGPNSGNSSLPSTGPATPTPKHAKLAIVRVTTASATIHAALRGSNLVCKLSKWNGRRWGQPRVARCGTSVTYRHLTAGRYRLTVASGKTSAARIIALRHGVVTHVTRPRRAVRSHRSKAT